MNVKCFQVAHAILGCYSIASLAIICWFVNLGYFPYKYMSGSWNPNPLYVQGAVGAIIVDAWYIVWSFIPIFLNSKLTKNKWAVYVFMFFGFTIAKIIFGSLFLSGSGSHGYYDSLENAIDYNNANHIDLTGEQRAFTAAKNNEIASIIVFFFVGTTALCSNSISYESREATINRANIPPREATNYQANIPTNIEQVEQV